MNRITKEAINKNKKIKQSTYKMIINSLLPAINLNQQEYSKREALTYRKLNEKKKQSYLELVNALLPAINLNQTNKSEDNLKEDISSNPIEMIKQYYDLKKDYNLEKERVDKVNSILTDKSYMNIIEQSTKSLMVSNSIHIHNLSILNSFLKFILNKLHFKDGLDLKLITNKMKEYKINWNEGEIIYYLFLMIKAPNLLKQNQSQFLEHSFSGFLKESNYEEIALNSFKDSTSVYPIFLKALRKKELAHRLKVFVFIHLEDPNFIEDKFFFLQDTKAICSIIFELMKANKLVANLDIDLNTKVNIFQKLIIEYKDVEFLKLYYNIFINPYLSSTQPNTLDSHIITTIINYLMLIEKPFNFNNANKLVDWVHLSYKDGQLAYFLPKIIHKLIRLDYLQPILKLFRQLHHNEFTAPFYFEENPNMIQSFIKLADYLILKRCTKEAFTIIMQLHNNKLLNSNSIELDVIWLLWAQFTLSSSKHLAQKTLQILREISGNKDFWKYRSERGQINPKLFTMYYLLVKGKAQLCVPENENEVSIFIPIQKCYDHIGDLELDQCFKDLQSSLQYT